MASKWNNIYILFFLIILNSCSKDEANSINESSEIESISLNFSEVDLKAEGTQQLSITFLPENTINKNVIWSTDNGNIADVNNNGFIVARNIDKQL